MDDRGGDGSWAGLATAWLARAEAGCEALGPQWRLVRATSPAPLFVLAGRRRPPDAGLEIALPVIEPEGASAPFALLCGPADSAARDSAGPDLAELLSELLGPLREAETRERESVVVPHDGEADATTGFGGSMTWSRLLAVEDEHCRVLGHCATVLLTEIDRPPRGTEPEVARRWVQRGAAALRRSLRDRDGVCLLRPGRYGILAVECPVEHADALADRLTGALLDVGIGASVAAASLGPSEPDESTDGAHADAPSRLGAALRAAEERLIAVQAARKTLRL